MHIVLEVNPKTPHCSPLVVGVIVEGNPKQVREIFHSIAREQGCEVTEGGVVVCSPEAHLFLVETRMIDQVQLRKTMMNLRKRPLMYT
jgi:nitrate reductase NapAB chaperone NapD